MDEKVVMKVTDAREPIRKAPQHQLIGHDDINIFEILQMFRDGSGARGGQNNPLQQILMAAAEAERDHEEDDYERHLYE